MKILTSLLLALMPTLAASQVNLQSVSTTALSANQRANYKVNTTLPGQLSLEIRSPDGDLVRTLTQPKTAAPGTHTFTWNGTDAKGKPVANEAYCARAVLKTKTTQTIDDPCQRTGGEVLEGITASTSAQGDISYTLEKPARVLVRVGMKNGAMMRSLAVWQPRAAGRNLHHWNGFDENHQTDLRTPRLALMVSAFTLPDFSVITSTQNAPDYRTWRRQQGWSEKPDTPIENHQLERAGKRIARQHHMPRFKNSEPRINIKLTDTQGQALDTTTLPDKVRISVDLHPDDRWLMQEQLYEVGFFVNGDFVSEEENGYVPIGWIWNTAELKPGQHLLTVNLTGFTGRVGTKTLVLNK